MAPRSMADKRAARAFGYDETTSPIVGALNKEIVRLKHTMPHEEARMIVRKYFDIQQMRIGLRLADGAGTKAGTPSDILQYLGDNFELLEKEIQRLLIPYAKAHAAGKWMLSQKGIGGVIAAGILSEIDITKAPTAGHIMSFAGLIPGQKLVKGERRSWNAQLKLLMYYAGESFAKQSNREDAYYGQVYKWAKHFEWQRNLSGEHVAEAQRALSEKNYSKNTEAYKWYSGQYTSADFKGTFIKGIEASDDAPGLQMLPPAHIYARAKRRAAKMFVHHLHYVWYESHFGIAPPSPYAIAHLGHADFYPPPNWTVKGVPVAVAPWQKSASSVDDIPNQVSE